MTTAVTKESLAARIAELESGPRSLKEDYTLAAYKMLLATMESEPVDSNSIVTAEWGQSMTDNKLTPTHLAVKSELDGYKIHASRGQATAMAMVRLFESIDRDLEELQERRQSAMNSEPVACNAAAALRACLPEFHEDFRDIVEECADIAENACRAARQPAPVVPDKMTAIVKDEAEYVEGWNDCRAAMLAAAQQSTGSELATVPGKWIPVSERMPEEGGRYWCYVEEQNSLGKSHYQWNCSWNGDVWSDKALTGRVTHWMPLPAAPAK